jgi:aminoglycoside phosphotransferase (APT) family kinase protein
LLRLYQHDPAQARKEVAILNKVAGQVPVPAVLHYSDDNPITGSAYTVMEWIEGERLDIIAPTLDRDHLAQLGHAIGQALGAIHGFSFDKTGFLNGDLEVAEPVDLGQSGLIAYLEACLVAGRGAARLGANLTTELLALVERRGDLLDTWLDGPCLVHADFNGSNILVRQRPSDGDWEVAAVLDWEFAFSGSPAFDFGHVLRPPLGRLEALTEAIAKSYRESGRRLPPNWRQVARIADLFAWAEFLGRPNVGSALIADAHEAILNTISDIDADYSD